MHRCGLRFRLDGRGLPGKPDIVLPKHRTVIFVHGCFWHLHRGCKQARMPASNEDYWKGKLEANRARDRSHRATLQKTGWRVITVWECTVMKSPNKALDDILLAMGMHGEIEYRFSMPDRAALKAAEKRSRYLIARRDRKRGRAP